MPGDEEQSRDSEASRKFLESLLAQCRSAPLPGSQHLIEMIERALAAQPLPDEPRVEVRDTPRDDDRKDDGSA